MKVDVEPAAMDDVDAVADLWVDLAAGQREYRSHLLAEPNRAAVADALARSVVRGDLLVARGPIDAADGGPAGRRYGTTRRDTGRGRDRGGVGPIVGFVMFGVESGTYEQDATIGAVHNLYVRPAARDAGVGSALLAAAERALDEAGADTVSLEAMVDNEAALRFYRARGYHAHRVELEKSLDGGDDDRDAATDGGPSADDGGDRPV